MINHGEPIVTARYKMEREEMSGKKRRWRRNGITEQFEKCLKK